MAIAERLGATLAAGLLTQSADHSAAADAVGALAFAGRLGGALVRLRAAGDWRAGQVAALLLAKRLTRARPTLTRGFATRIAAAAVREWVDGACRSCHGAGRKRDERGVVHVCGRCEGVGVHRHSDTARARAIGVSTSKPLPAVVRRHFDGLVGDCQTAYAGALRRTRQQLYGEKESC